MNRTSTSVSARHSGFRQVNTIRWGDSHSIIRPVWNSSPSTHLVEPTPNPGLEMNLLRPVAPERVPLLERPPLSDAVSEQPERLLDRAIHTDVLPNRHCSSRGLGDAMALTN